MVFTFALVAALAAPVTGQYCESAWPAAAKPTADQSKGCLAHFLRITYGPKYDKEALSLDPGYGHGIEVKLTTDQLKKMVAHAKTACAGGDHPTESDCVRGLEFLEGMVDRRMSLFEDVNMGSFEPVLKKVLAGEKLERSDLVMEDGPSWSPLTLWRLRNAAYARHGYQFEKDDLNAFFYGPRDERHKTALLPLPKGTKKKVELTPIDGQNVRLIKDIEKGAKK